MSTYDELRAILPDTAKVDDRGMLVLGGVRARELADTYGTPVVVYDGQHLDRAASAWVEAVALHAPGGLVAYASKAFSSVGLLRRMVGLGLGADVASRGELESALRARVPASNIVLHGNNKSRAELDAALEYGVGLVVLDAADELELLEELARERGVQQDVLVRLNPDIVVETHHYINTAHAGSKFGVPASVAAELLRRAAASEWLTPRGVHVHLGSQLLDLAPWGDVVDWLADWALELRERDGITIDTLDVGGGLGIAYVPGQEPPTPDAVVHAVATALRRSWVERSGLHMPRLVLEPGRSIVGSAAVTLYEVGVVKDTADGGPRYVNVDGGMSDNPRPVLYQAQYSAMLAERASDVADGVWWIAGVHCESGDVLVEDAPLPRPVRGELLAIPATGAYAVSMSSTYNLVPRAAVVLVEHETHRTLLRRESLDELLARDVDASDLDARESGTTGR